MAQLLVVLYAIGEGVVEHDPCSPFHHVEGSPYDGLILAEEVRFRGERVDSVEPGQDARLAAHVVGLRRDRSERWAAQNALPVPYLQEVRQVGGTGGELADFELAFWHVLYVCPQITLVRFVAFGEVESQQGAVVQAKAIHIHTREDRRRAEEVLDVEATPCARADEIDGVRLRGSEVVSYCPSVAEGSEEDCIRRGHVGDGAGAVGGHKDHVFVPDDLGRVLFREGTVIVALYPRRVLLAAAQERAGVQPPPDLIYLLPARRGVDVPCAVLQDGQQGRRHEHVEDDGRGARKALGHDLLPRH